MIRKCGKKTKRSRVSRKKRNRRVSRKKQRGGDYGAILRKNAHKHGDKDIKKYTLTKRGIEWVPGTKTRFKGLLGKGSEGLIRYSDIPSQESIRKVGNNKIEVDTSSKTYVFDNDKPCIKNSVRCVGNRSLDRFFKALVRKWTEHNTGVYETGLEALARHDREDYGVTTLPASENDDDLMAEFEDEMREETRNLRGGRKQKNKSRKCRRTRRTRRKRRR